MAWAACLALSACGPGPLKPSLNESDPAGKIPAMVQLGQGEAASPEQLRELIEALDSEDPAVRLYAIETLHRVTRRDFGYRYYAPPDERRERAARWRLWLEGGVEQVQTPEARP